MSMPFIGIHVSRVVSSDDLFYKNYNVPVDCKDTFSITPEEYDAAYMKAFLNIWNDHSETQYAEKEFRIFGDAYAVMATATLLEERGYEYSYSMGRG
jgi:hypothetical protein